MRSRRAPTTPDNDPRTPACGGTILKTANVCILHSTLLSQEPRGENSQEDPNRPHPEGDTAQAEDTTAQGTPTTSAKSSGLTHTRRSREYPTNSVPDRYTGLLLRLRAPSTYINCGLPTGVKSSSSRAQKADPPSTLPLPGCPSRTGDYP